MVKQRRGYSEELKTLMVFGVMLAITVIPPVILPLCSGNVAGVLGLIWAFGLIALAFFVLVFLRSGWKHPKWYVKGYTVVCIFWELYCASLFFFGRPAGISRSMHVARGLGLSGYRYDWFLLAPALALPPLIPIWYWDYKTRAGTLASTNKTLTCLKV